MGTPHEVADSATAKHTARLDHDFPKKRISAGAIIRNLAGELLIVRPTYRDGWLLPGGICEADESPATALRRELAEELSIAPEIQGLACVDYLAPTAGFGEAINFLFYCRPLTALDTDAIELDLKELSTYRFCTDDQASQLLVPSIAKRLTRIAGRSTCYLENGDIVVPTTEASDAL
jgi:8-oxo-dGTP diphosphatase